MKKKTKFLGHVIGPDGVQPDPEKCSKILDFQV
jgi:hypothetical protein